MPIRRTVPTLVAVALLGLVWAGCSSSTAAGATCRPTVTSGTGFTPSAGCGSCPSVGVFTPEDCVAFGHAACCETTTFDEDAGVGAAGAGCTGCSFTNCQVAPTCMVGHDL